MTVIKRKHLGWLFGAAVGFSFFACNTIQRVDQAQTTANLAFREPEWKGRQPARKLPVILQDSIFGSKLTISRDWVTGEHVKHIDLDRVRIVSRSNIVSERNGRIKLDFIIRVPKPFTQQDWKISIVPMLDNRGRITTLKPVDIRGHVNDNYYNRKDLADKRRLRRDVWISEQLEGRTDFFRTDGEKAESTVQAREALSSWIEDKRLALLGLKLDTVTGHRMWEYCYSQDFPADQFDRELKMYFTARVENMGRSRYILQTKDTLTYYITSLAEFCDDRVRYHALDNDSTFREEFHTRLVFRQGRSDLDLTIDGNREALLQVEQFLSESEKQAMAQLESVTVAAACSPEGSLELNNRLGRARGNRVKEVLSAKFPHIPFRVDNEVENWSGLLSRMEAVSLGHKSEIRKLIACEEDADLRESIIRQRYPDDYQTIRKFLYPVLREVVITCRYAANRQAPGGRLVNESYMRALRLMHECRYSEALPMLESYRDWNTAVCYLCMGRNCEAKALFESFPETADQLYLRAIVNERLGNDEEAVILLLRAYDMDANKYARLGQDEEIGRLVSKYNLR